MKQWQVTYMDNYKLINYILGLEDYNNKDARDKILSLIDEVDDIEYKDSDEIKNEVINGIVENNSIYYQDIYNINNIINLFIKDYENIVEDSYDDIRQENIAFYKVLTYINSKVIEALFYNFINEILDNEDYKDEV